MVTKLALAPIQSELYLNASSSHLAGLMVVNSAMTTGILSYEVGVVSLKLQQYLFLPMWLWVKWCSGCLLRTFLFSSENYVSLTSDS